MMTAIDLGRQALMTSLLLVAPVLLIGLLVGVVSGALQTITQVQDQSLSHVPRIVAIIATFAICMPWLIQKLVEYSDELFRNAPMLMGGG